MLWNTGKVRTRISGQAFTPVQVAAGPRRTVASALQGPAPLPGALCWLLPADVVLPAVGGSGSCGLRSSHGHCRRRPRAERPCTRARGSPQQPSSGASPRAARPAPRCSPGPQASPCAAAAVTPSPQPSRSLAPAASAASGPCERGKPHFTSAPQHLRPTRY